MKDSHGLKGIGGLVPIVVIVADMVRVCSSSQWAACSEQQRSGLRAVGVAGPRWLFGPIQPKYSIPSFPPPSHRPDGDY